MKERNKFAGKIRRKEKGSFDDAQERRRKKRRRRGGASLLKFSPERQSAGARLRKERWQNEID